MREATIEKNSALTSLRVPLELFVEKMAYIMRNMHRHSGFSLIELLIVMAVMGILTAIAFPSYQEHVKKVRRLDGKSFMLDIAQRQQRYFTEYNQYAPDLNTLFGDNTNGGNLRWSPDSWYRVQVLAQNGNACDTANDCYRLRAKPQGAHLGDRMYDLWSTEKKRYKDSSGWHNGWD